MNIAQGAAGAAVLASGDFVQDCALTPYRQSAVAVSEAWNDPALLDKTVQLPFGAFPGAFALGIHTVESIVHGWDVATATGQPRQVAPELLAVAWQHCQDIDDSFRGPGRPFGPACTAPAQASGTDILMAWLGRRP